MSSPERPNLNRIQNWEAGKFPESVTYQGNEFQKANENDGLMTYSRKVESPDAQTPYVELLIVDSDGFVISHLKPTQEDVSDTSMRIAREKQEEEEKRKGRKA